MLLNKFKVIAWVFIGFLIACKADVGNLFQPTYHSQMAAPLAYGKLDIFDLVKDENSLFSKNTDSQLVTNYSFNFFDLPLRDLIAFKSDFTRTTNLNITNNLLLGFYVPNQSFDVDITNGFIHPLTQLENMQCISGQMDITLRNKLQIPVKDILVQFKNVSKNGTQVPDVLFSTINPGSSQTFSINISDYLFNLKGKNAGSVNSLFCQLIADSTKNSGSVLQYNLLTDSLKLEFKFKNLIVLKGVGKFGTLNIEAKDTAKLFGPEFYGNFQSGSIDLKNTKVQILVDNTGGIPFDLGLDFKSVNGKTGNEVTLSPRPSLQLIKANENPLAPNPGNVLFVSNATGYNLDDVMSNTPKSLILKMTLNNPNTDPTAFVYPESRVKVGVDISIPLDVHFNKLVLKDTFDFSIGNFVYEVSSGEDTTNTTYESGTLYFRNLNGFPVDFNFTARLFDKDKNPIIDLFSNQFVKAGQVGSNGKVDKVEQTIFSVPVSAANYYKLNKTKFIEVTYQIDNKTNSSNYKIYSNYLLDFKVSGEIKMKKKY